MADTAQHRFEALAQLKTLDQYIPNRVKVAPHSEALRQFDRRTNSWERISYRDLSERIYAWRRAFAKMGLPKGARIAVLLPNGVDAVCCDQAALANGLVTVPLHAIDTPNSSAFIIADSEASVLVTNQQNRWDAIFLTGTVMPSLTDVIFTEELTPESLQDNVRRWDLEHWLANGRDIQNMETSVDEDDLAAIVYTSGTTGRPKGVMLTHKNVVSNVVNTLRTVVPQPGDIFLSFLPLSHTFERMAGYYLALGMGCTIVFNRSIPQLSEDFRIVRPNVIISVPRIYERIYAKVQEKLAKGPAISRFLFNWAVDVGWRNFCKKNNLKLEKSCFEFLDPIVWPILKATVSNTLLKQFGGRLNIAISGGAALNTKVAKTFCGLGLPIIQGYGMTESSPIIGGNSLSYNRPHTVGKPLPNTHVRLDEETGEIQVKSDSIMKGYWKRPEDTKAAFTEDGWFRTGDAGYMKDGFLFLTERIKDLFKTSNGKYIAPQAIETKMVVDRYIDQISIIADERKFVAALIVPDYKLVEQFAAEKGIQYASMAELLKHEAVMGLFKERIDTLQQQFAHYEQIKKFTLLPEPFSMAKGELTNTLKIKRSVLNKNYAAEIEAMYAE